MNSEIWILNPLFPWIMITLAFWVACATMAIVRNWIKFRKLEKRILIITKKLINLKKNINVKKNMFHKSNLFKNVTP